MGLCSEMESPKIPRIERMGYGIISGSLAIGLTALFAAKLTWGPLAILFSLIFFAASWGLLFLLWNWVFVTRPKRVKKNVPITSNEWRRRQKQFYDNLPR